MFFLRVFAGAYLSLVLGHGECVADVFGLCLVRLRCLCVEER
jgi:hypothetical protein